MQKRSAAALASASLSRGPTAIVAPWDSPRSPGAHRGHPPRWLDVVFLSLLVALPAVRDSLGFDPIQVVVDSVAGVLMGEPVGAGGDEAEGSRPLTMAQAAVDRGAGELVPLSPGDPFRIRFGGAGGELVGKAPRVAVFGALQGGMKGIVGCLDIPSERQASRVRFRMAVAAGGGGGQALVQSNSGFSEAAASCMEALLEGIDMPPSGGHEGYVVFWPVTLEGMRAGEPLPGVRGGADLDPSPH